MAQRINIEGVGPVDFPDDMTRDQIAAAIKANTPKPDDGSGLLKASTTGVGKGLIGIAGGPADALAFGAKAGEWIGRKLGYEPSGAAQDFLNLTGKVQKAAGSQAIQKGIEGYTGEFYKPQTTGEKYAQTIGEFAPAAIAGPGGVARRLITQAMIPGAVSEAAGQASEGKWWEPYARMGGAVLGSFAPGAVARAVTPIPSTPARQRLVDVLNEEGVTSTTAGQRTGSEALKYAESTLGNAPGAGGAANRIVREGEGQLTEAALRRAGTAGEATPETLAANQQRLGDTFRDLSARNTLQMDPQFGRDVGQAIRHYERVPPSQQKAIVENYVNDIIDHAARGGTMPGPDYQAMRSMLSTQSKGVRQTDHYLSNALRDLRDALDNAMGRSISPADRELWNATRREYGAQKVIEKSMSGASEAAGEGRIPPQALRATVAAENRGAHARGEGDFSELARAASTVMKPLPQSGTGPRAAMHAIASLMGGAAGSAGGLGVGSGAGAVAGAIAGPAIAGRALMSAPVQGYLGNQLLTPILPHVQASRGNAAIAALMAAQQQPQQFTLGGP